MIGLLKKPHKNPIVKDCMMPTLKLTKQIEIIYSKTSNTHMHMQKGGTRGIRAYVLRVSVHIWMLGIPRVAYTFFSPLPTYLKARPHWPPFWTPQF